jgi:hypothetical protein
MLKDSLPLVTYLVYSSPAILYSSIVFLVQMAGNKRKGKAVAEPKKKKSRQQKEWTEC